MTSYRYIGYGVTDSNGVAHLDHDPQGNSIDGYTGTGSGEVDVIASTDNPITSSSIVSEIYDVWDTIRYDDGTGSIYVPNANGVKTIEDDGVLFTAIADYGTNYIGNGTIHPIDSVLEFDVVSETGRCSLSFFNNSQPTKDAFEFNSYSNRGVGHWRIEVRNTSIKFFRDGVELTGSPVSVDFGNNPMRIGFICINSASASIKIANFKEYYI